MLKRTLFCLLFITSMAFGQTKQIFNHQLMYDMPIGWKANTKQANYIGWSTPIIPGFVNACVFEINVTHYNIWSNFIPNDSPEQGWNRNSPDSPTLVIPTDSWKTEVGGISTKAVKLENWMFFIDLGKTYLVNEARWYVRVPDKFNKDFANLYVLSYQGTSSSVYDAHLPEILRMVNSIYFLK